MVTATADGAIAAVELERYAKQMSEKTGLVPPRPHCSAYEESEAKAASAASAADDARPGSRQTQRRCRSRSQRRQEARELFSAAVSSSLAWSSDA